MRPKLARSCSFDTITRKILRKIGRDRQDRITKKNETPNCSLMNAYIVTKQ
jgi:hypothetical protein